MKKCIGILLLCAVLCAACQPGNRERAADESGSESAMETEKGEASAGEGISACGPAITSYESEEALLAALRDEKALKEVIFLSEIRYWYKLKNIPDGYVEDAFDVLADSNVCVSYATAMEDEDSSPMAYCLPITLQFMTGCDFEEVTTWNKGGRFVGDSIYYLEGGGIIEWMEGEDMLIVNIPGELDENLEFHRPKLTDEEVLNLAQVVRVDPFK